MTIAVDLGRKATIQTNKQTHSNARKSHTTANPPGRILSNFTGMILGPLSKLLFFFKWIHSIQILVVIPMERKIFNKNLLFKILLGRFENGWPLTKFAKINLNCLKTWPPGGVVSFLYVYIEKILNETTRHRKGDNKKSCFSFTCDYLSCYRENL